MSNWWILRALLSHWMRRPFQLFTLLLGLAIGTALWSGVQAVNAEARASYARAAGMLGGDMLDRLISTTGADIAQADYIALRRAGWQVSPVLEGRVRVGGEGVRVIGVDPLTAPAETQLGGAVGDGEVAQFFAPPYLGFAHPVTAERLSGVAPLPELRPFDGLVTGAVVVDIGLAQDLLDRDGLLSYLTVHGEQPAGLPALEEVTGDRLRRSAPEDSGMGLGQLTDSFHLNLTAFGFLSFVVGLFIVNAAIGLAFEQRKPLFRTLRTCGASARALVFLLGIELLTLAVIAGGAGIAMGYLLAGALLPDVAASLRGLYGASVSGELTLQPIWWLTGGAISLFGAGVAAAQSLWRAYRLPLLAPAQPQAWLAAQHRTLRLQGFGALVLLTAAALLAVFGTGLIAGFATLGALLIGAALGLPILLGIALAMFERRSSTAFGQWFWADTRQQLTSLSLALMALLLALSVNIGVGTMVDSFRTTFLGWLDQRLTPELYIAARTPEEAEAFTAWIAPRSDAILPVWSVEEQVQGWPVEIYGVPDHPTYRDNWPLLSNLPQPWDAIAAGNAAHVSEQLARRFDLTPGDTVTVPTRAGAWEVTVAGIYADYGNPIGQLRIDVDALTDRWPEVERLRFAIRMAPEDVTDVIAGMREAFTLDPNQLIDQTSLKAMSRGIFERTFTVTAALNVLTLAVAALALLTSLLTLSTMRLPQLAPVWALGLTRRQLGWVELGKSLMLAGFTAVIALPVGLAVAWLLLAVVNVQAFGWRLPLHLFPIDWARLGLLAMLTALLASALPIWRLARTPPGRLLQVFANER
ncbi:MAG: ABC transporter permease [Pseudomonadota bacterium]